ncbi:MAG: hypothetical protein KAI50_00940 [Desulfobacterales bacterium]|nr:hypothetical protein [Desulfobacterales bacterium]
MRDFLLDLHQFFVHSRLGWSASRSWYISLQKNRPTQGLVKNKFAILSVDVPVWQGAKAQEYQDIPSFCNVAMRDASALKM